MTADGEDTAALFIITLKFKDLIELLNFTKQLVACYF